MLCLPGFGTHANTQNLPHFRAFPAGTQEHSPPKCLFFMANAKLPNRPGFALLHGFPPELENCYCITKLAKNYFLGYAILRLLQRIPCGHQITLHNCFKID